MKTLSLDLRERIVETYDTQTYTREEVAKRFRVSLGMVKKLLQQRRHTKELGPRHHNSGRKPKILPEYGEQLQKLVAAQPDLTLAQIKAKLAMPCTVPAVHYALIALGLTYKKRRSTPPSKADRMWSKNVASGGPRRASLTPADSSSSTNRRPKRT
jgi:transposase